MKGSFFDVAYQFVGSCIGVAAMSMALVGSSYVGNIRWSLPSRICFFAIFLWFHHPRMEIGYRSGDRCYCWFSCYPAGVSLSHRYLRSFLIPTHSAIQSGTIEKENEAERSEDLR